MVRQVLRSFSVCNANNELLEFYTIIVLCKKLHALKYQLSKHSSNINFLNIFLMLDCNNCVQIRRHTCGVDF